MTQSASYLEQLRLQELRSALDWIPSRQRILEIGAGAGWQSLELSRMGHLVQAVDLADSTYAARRVWPIRDYDGTHLPFEDNSFDVVFSSNVLEHVTDLRALLREMIRVVRPEGHLVHVVPSATWRLWTLVSYYPDLMRKLWRALWARSNTDASLAGSIDGGHAADSHDFRGGRNLVDAFLPPAHGSSHSAFGEIRFFQESSWARTITQPDTQILRISASKLFYSGYALLGARLSFRARRFLASVLGSSCHIIVMSKCVTGECRHK